MQFTEDEEVQRKGCVVVYYGLDMVKPGPHNLEVNRKGVPMLFNVPLRMVGTHFCYDKAHYRPVMALFQMVAGKQIRMRFRPHYGE